MRYNFDSDSSKAYRMTVLKVIVLVATITFAGGNGRLMAQEGEEKEVKKIYCTIAGKKEAAKLSVSELLSEGKLSVKSGLKIVSYDVTYTKPRFENGKVENMFIVLKPADSADFTRELKGVIKNELQAGSKLYFENVKAERSSGKMVNVEGIEVTIE